ncbi:iron ABC transporter permease [Pigmentibacter sp. JX0631]|nr:iron ABC transporter permease [Pigmentibacter sp. JX0631]WGL61560.1 iron ABC transporter permease [Pigmentibacter sp. JX0631]
MIYLLFLIFISIISLKFGIVNYSLKNIFMVLIEKNNVDQSFFILHDVRLPRIIIGAFCGILFAVSGSILQSVFHNPMAAPDILGINSASSFFILINTFYLSKFFAFPNIYFSIFGAILGFLLAIIFTLEKKQILQIRLIIVGIACGVLFKALCQFLVMQTDEKFSAILKFITGTLYHSSWELIEQIFIPGCCFLFLTFLFLKKLDLLLLKDTDSKNLGFSPLPWKLYYIFLALGLSAVAVSGCGSLGFIGLISPNISKLLFGSQHKFNLIGSAFIGASITLLADFFGRIIYPPYEIPVGLITIILGVPYFLFLLKKTSKHN